MPRLYKIKLEKCRDGSVSRLKEKSRLISDVSLQKNESCKDAIYGVSTEKYKELVLEKFN